MRNSRIRGLLIFCALLAFAADSRAFAQAALPERAAVNVAGKWTVYTNGPGNKTGTKYFDLKQDGTVLSGHFKGPYQSGGIEGTVNGNHVFIRTKTRQPLRFRGVIEDDKMYGSYITREGSGKFQAERSE